MQCKNCYWAEEEKIDGRTYYYCHFDSQYIEDFIANDDHIRCEAYDDYRNDDTTKRP